MTDYKATPEQWKKIENSQVFNTTFQLCVLELRTRIEALEENFESFFESTNFCTNAVIDRLENLEFGAGIYEVVVKELKNNSSSLVERVTNVIKEIWHNYTFEEDDSISELEARAAIREVAAWLKEQESKGLVDLPEALEQEIEQ